MAIAPPIMPSTTINNRGATRAYRRARSSLADMMNTRLAASASLQHGIHHVKQRSQTERDILDPPVHEKCRRRAHAAVEPALQLLTHALQINLIVHLRDIPRHVEFEPLGIAPQVPCLQMLLVGEQQIVHLPELSLAPGALRRLGCAERMRMHLFERKMPVHETHTAGETLQQHLHRRLRLFAVGTLEIAVLDHRCHSVRRADHVIDGADGNCELKRDVRLHEASSPVQRNYAPSWRIRSPRRSAQAVSFAKTQLVYW